MPTVTVALPSPLRRAAGGAGELSAEGGTVAAALASLGGTHPVVARLLLKENGAPRAAVLLALNGVDVRRLDGLQTGLKEGDRLEVLLLVAGG